MTPMENLLDIMRKLRAPDGCPWDREQTHTSLKDNLLEEAGEFLDAVDDADDTAMREELGDLLMQIAMHAVIAEERKAFTFDDVADEISGKMVRRHPHVFASEHAENSEQVLRLWDAIKKNESSHAGRKSILDGIPRNAPALLQASKIQKRAAKTGFDWETPEQVLDKIQEELNELRDACARKNEDDVAAETGDLLFAIVNFARKACPQTTPESILARATGKFVRRYRYIEKKLAEAGAVPSPELRAEMEKLWIQAKEEGHLY